MQRDRQPGRVPASTAREQGRDPPGRGDALQGEGREGPHEPRCSGRPPRRQDAWAGKSDWKKAYVTLAEGAAHRLLRGSLARCRTIQYRPTSPARRFQTGYDFAEITKSTPERRCLDRSRSPAAATTPVASPPPPRRRPQAPLPPDRLQARQGSACRRRSRRIEYDPNRTARIALLHYADGEKRYILAPDGLERRRHASMLEPRRGHQAGQRMPLANIPLGTMIHNIEMREGQGRRSSRARPAAALQLMAKEGDYAHVQAALGRSPPRCASDCRATDRPGRQHRSREHLDRQGRPHALARPAPAQPRRRHEPGRPPAWAAAKAAPRGGSHPLLAVGPARPRATRRATTSAPTR